ncbi:MAG: DUF2254 domain-containing protein [Thermodesulfobacteriota bacterium]
MRTRLLNTWFNIKSSYWFIPTIMLISSFLLSFFFIWIDGMLPEEKVPEILQFFYLNRPEGARALLSTIAGSMITVAGVVFSITLVVLTLATSQFGPRILNNFIRDRGNQIVLGTFLSNFVYSLSVLRTIRGGEDNVFIPQVSIIAGFVLAIVSIFVLIYFIHHISTSIQVFNIVSNISSELKYTILKHFPEKNETKYSDIQKPWVTLELPPDDFEEKSRKIFSSKSGYIRVIDNDGLNSLAVKNELFIKLNCRPGDYIIEETIIAFAYPEDKCPESIESKINGVLLIGSRRTSEQDVEFPINQIVEIAIRALSPGINDPFTAIGCIDRLTDSLCIIARRDVPPRLKYDADNKLRIIAESKDFTDLLNVSFDQILHYGRSDFKVVSKLLDSINTINYFLHRTEDMDAAIDFTKLINSQSNSSTMVNIEKNKIEHRCQNTLEKLKELKLKQIF